MTEEQLASVQQVESVSIPIPGEFFVAISKASQPAWSQHPVMSPIPSTDSRVQIALLLGMLVADGYVAVEAVDGQTVKNIGREIIAQAEKLNVSQNVLGRSNSINDFADNNDWNAIREELEATQNEVKLDMIEQKDERLVILVTLGAWIRGVAVASGIIAENYTPTTARLLRQPAIVDYLIAQIEALPDADRDAPLLSRILPCLLQTRGLVQEPTPTQEQVAELHVLMSGLCDAISGKEPSP